MLAGSEPPEARGEQRPQPRAVAADEVIGKRKPGGAQVRLQDTVAEEPPARVLGGSEVPDGALARFGGCPDAVDVRIGNHAVQIRRAVQLREDGRCVESGDERRARLAQVPGELHARPRLCRAHHPPRPGSGARAIPRRPGRRNGGNGLYQRPEGSAHCRKLREPRERLVEVARASPEARVRLAAERRLLHPVQRNAERVRERERGAEVAIPHVDRGNDRSLASLLGHGIAASPACPLGCQGPPRPWTECTAWGSSWTFLSSTS